MTEVIKYTAYLNPIKHNYFLSPRRPPEESVIIFHFTLHKAPYNNILK